MEKIITAEQALEILSEHGGYGTVRVYGETPNGPVAIKSKYHLENYELTRIYAQSNDGTVPIFKA